MGDFFKGWRRRAGCATLLLAIGLTSLWVRSVFYLDQLVFNFQARTHIVGSCRTSVYWMSLDEKCSGMRWDVIPVDVELSLPRLLDAAVAEQKEAGMNPAVSYAFYWCFVMPLTVLSAYLILWPQQRRALACE